jgi:shikimate kinase
MLHAARCYLLSVSAPGHIVLMGLMGSGKTSVGSRLAALLKRPFVDNDDALFRRTGRAARDIAAADGLAALHHAEADALAAALADPAPSVVGAAAAAVLEPAGRAALSGSFVVYLRARPDVLEARLVREPDDGHRPKLDLVEQYSARDPVYSDLAALVVDSERHVDEVVETIVDAISAAAG